MSTNSTTAGPTRGEPGAEGIEGCTLSAEGLRERLAWIRAEILPHAVASETLEDGIAWDFADAPGLAAKLDQLVTLERECCSGIVFQQDGNLAAGRRRLEARGIDPRAAGFATLQVGVSEPRSLGARLARAAGFGTLLSLLVCCVLPIVAAALVGASAAAPFASLDDPWMIGGAMVLSGGAAFVWQSRRRASVPARDRADVPCGSDCQVTVQRP